MRPGQPTISWAEMWVVFTVCIRTQRKGTQQAITLVQGSRWGAGKEGAAGFSSCRKCCSSSLHLSTLPLATCVFSHHVVFAASVNSDAKHALRRPSLCLRQLAGAEARSGTICFKSQFLYYCSCFRPSPPGSVRLWGLPIPRVRWQGASGSVAHGRRDGDPERRGLAGAMLSSLNHCVLSLPFSSTMSRFPRAFQIINCVWITFPFLNVGLIFQASRFDPGFHLLLNHY